ncbi:MULTISPECIES: response regulator [Bacillaceae]|uniref:Response regulator n=1 Tax=Evansella alkalicola TaxID=745819 RepID=A0ABS6JYM2_9BACI|nr:MULTISPECIES: response regulator [Bacillaceae]MBU9723701.1 response regulator [Bacillus alkalicola]
MKVRVMLVDDESIERDGLKLMLSRNRPDVEIVAEASDGKEAVEFALIHQPDIIFMDIKMPEMDGVSAVKEIMTKLPDTKCIMVTAFDTFQYAQEVMQYGVKEYLLKPSKKGVVLEAFDRMAAEIGQLHKVKEEKQEIHHRLQRISSVAESEFIVSLMMDYVYDHSIEEWTEWLELDGQQGFVAVFSFDSHIAIPERSVKTEWYRILKRVLHEQNHPCIVGPLIGFQVPAFITLKSDGLRPAKHKEHIIKETIQCFQGREKGCKLIAGMGNVISDFSQFSVSYAEAVYALDDVYAKPGSNFKSFEPKLKRAWKEKGLYDYERELFKVVKSGDLQKGLQAFETYFQLMSEEANHQLEKIMKSTDIFFNVLIREMKELGVTIEHEEQFQLLTTPGQVKEAAKVELTNIIHSIATWRKDDMKGQLARAKDYINNHFHLKSISLEMVAEEVGLSSYYLSKLFKDRYGKTFIDYLTEVRINKAKGFLLDPKKPLKEIAINIGYKDPNYFSRVFKKETGLNPSEYREKHSLS